MLQNYFEFSNRSLYNNSLRHFRIVTNIVKQLGGGYNAADLINQTRENFDLTDPQILSIINVLLADKYGYSYLSVDIRQPGVQPENFYSIINKCGTFDIIVVYHHPQTGVCVLNHNNKVAWAAVSEFRAGDYLVVYTKAQSVEDKSQEKLLLTSLQDVLTGNAGDIDETFAVKFKKPQAYSTEPVKVPATKTASAPETPVSGIQIQQTTSSDKEDHAGETNAVPEITGKLKMSPKYSCQVTNELFHNGNVEAWKNIVESYHKTHPQIKVLVFHNGEKINNLNTLFKWGKVKHGDVILFSLLGEEFKNVSKLQRYLFEGASNRFNKFLKKDLNKTLDLF